jgi:hypothetical protein
MLTGIAALELVAALGVIALLVLGGTVGWERYRRPGGPGVRPTAELFIDPETGRRTRVWYDPTTGAREYRPE